MKDFIKKYVFSIIVLMLSLFRYNGDMAKFLFTGYSATYDITIIRHHYLLTLSVAILVILSIIIYRVYKKRGLRYLTVLFVFIWVLSMRTFAIVHSEQVLVSGWSIIPIKRCEFSKNQDAQLKCAIKYDPFLKRKFNEKVYE